VGEPSTRIAPKGSESPETSGPEVGARPATSAPDEELLHLLGVLPHLQGVLFDPSKEKANYLRTCNKRK